MKTIRVLIALLVLPFGAAAQWPGSTNPNSERPKQEVFGAYEKGNKATGGEGCYFGECGDGTSRPAPPKNTDPAPAPGDTKPTSYPPQSQPIPSSITRICQTPRFWCMTFSPGMVGQPCYCNIPMPPGYVMGYAVPQQ